MICIWQVFGGVQDFTSIAGIFISDLIGTTTIFGNGLSRGRVCIKACNFQSEGQVRASDIADLEGGHSSAYLISICKIFMNISY